MTLIGYASKCLFYIAPFLISAIMIALLSQAKNEKNTLSCEVTRVIDGDTIKCEITVRLIGVDAPENKRNAKLFRDANRGHQSPDGILRQGKISHRHTESNLINKTVSLEFDKEYEDLYGRTLAYVWLGPRMWNKEMIEGGYGKSMFYSPNKKYEDYLTGAMP